MPHGQKLRDYQRATIDFILDVPRANVWQDMGLGKTLAVLSALDILWLSGSRFHPALVLAPLRVARDTWPGEAAKWDHLNGMRVVPVIGNAKRRNDALKQRADVYAINYENVPWLVDKLGSDWPFKVIIADESTRLKSFRLRRGGTRAAALNKIASMTGRWINLTGTPSPNGLIDLWGQQWFIDHGHRLGRTYTDFKRRWFDENQYSRKITPLPAAYHEIPDAVADVTISLKAADYLELPPTIHNTVSVELPNAARELYQQMEDELAIVLDGQEVEAPTAAAVLMKCQQITNGAVYTDARANEWKEIHDAKIDAMKSIVGEQAGAPLIVVYHFKSDLARLRKAFPYGRTLDTAKDIKDWNAGKVPVLFLHPQSAGHGLNLQDGGNAMAFFTHTWNLEYEQQVIERIGPVRQLQSGYNRPVILHHVVARDTVDEDVVERLKTKADLQDLLRERVNRRRGQ